MINAPLIIFRLQCCLSASASSLARRRSLSAMKKAKPQSSQSMLRLHLLEPFSKMTAKSAVVPLHVIPTQVSIHREFPGCLIESGMTYETPWHCSLIMSPA